MADDRKLFRPGDAVMVIVLLLGTALAAMLINRERPAGAAVISVNGNVIARTALDKDGDYRYPELPGVVFTVEDGSVRISENDCADLVCVRTGKISRKGEAIICMPKKITVEIEGDSDLDVVLR